LEGLSLPVRFEPYIERWITDWCSHSGNLALRKTWKLSSPTRSVARLLLGNYWLPFGPCSTLVADRFGSASAAVRVLFGCRSGTVRLEVEAEPKRSRSPAEGDPSMGRSSPEAEPNESRSALESKPNISNSLPVNPAHNPAIEKVKYIL